MRKKKQQQRHGSTRIVFDSAKDKATEVIGDWFAAGSDAGVPLFAITWNAFADLCAELGSWGVAANWIAEQVIKYDRPVIFEVSPARLEGDDSETMTVGPPTWTQEKLEGFIAGSREQIAGVFGEISTMRRMPPVR